MFVVSGLRFSEEKAKTCQMEQRHFAVDFKDGERFMKSLLCVFIHHIVMMSFSNSTKETNFIPFPMYSKAQLNIFDLMKVYCVQGIFSGVWPANNYQRKV